MKAAQEKNQKKTPKKAIGTEEKESTYVGPEGQRFAGHDSHPGAAPSRRINEATNQHSKPEPREDTNAEPYQGLARDRTTGPDYRHN